MSERATRGFYPSSSLKDLPDEWKRLAFEPTGDLFRLRDEFRKDIQLLPQDVRVEQPLGQFDMILCRHLALTYFDEQTQRASLESMVDQLESGGILVTGKQETLPIEVGSLEECFEHSGIYRLVGP